MQRVDMSPLKSDQSAGSAAPSKGRTYFILAWPHEILTLSREGLQSGNESSTLLPEQLVAAPPWRICQPYRAASTRRDRRLQPRLPLPGHKFGPGGFAGCLAPQLEPNTRPHHPNENAQWD